MIDIQNSENAGMGDTVVGSGYGYSGRIRIQFLKQLGFGFIIKFTFYYEILKYTLVIIYLESMKDN